MKQELVNTVYDKLDEVRDAFETYIDRTDPSSRSVKAIADRLDSIVRAIRKKCEV